MDAKPDPGLTCAGEGGNIKGVQGTGARPGVDLGFDRVDAEIGQCHPFSPTQANLLCHFPGNHDRAWTGSILCRAPACKQLAEHAGVGVSGQKVDLAGLSRARVGHGNISRLLLTNPAFVLKYARSTCPYFLTRHGQGIFIALFTRSLNSL